MNMLYPKRNIGVASSFEATFVIFPIIQLQIEASSLLDTP